MAATMESQAKRVSDRRIALEAGGLPMLPMVIRLIYREGPGFRKDSRAHGSPIGLATRSRPGSTRNRTGLSPRTSPSTCTFVGGSA